MAVQLKKSRDEVAAEFNDATEKYEAASERVIQLQQRDYHAAKQNLPQSQELADAVEEFKKAGEELARCREEFRRFARWLTN